MVAQYYTAEQFALLLSLKFGSIALYVGGRVYNLYKQYRAYQQFQRVTQNIATRARSNAVSSSNLFYLFLAQKMKKSLLENFIFYAVIISYIRFIISC